MSALKESLKNEYTKQILRATGIRKASLEQRKTPHYRMPILEQAGGWLKLKKYDGAEIPPSEWESLTYTTYTSDPTTFFAPITSATGEIELKGFWEYGKADLDGVWTENAKKSPTLVNWIEGMGVRFGRVQLLRMSPNTIRECRWGLHLDNNNQGNPESNGWVVRMWLELTDDGRSRTCGGRCRSPRSRTCGGRCRRWRSPGCGGGCSGGRRVATPGRRFGQWDLRVPPPPECRLPGPGGCPPPTFPFAFPLPFPFPPDDVVVPPPPPPVCAGGCGGTPGLL